MTLRIGSQAPDFTADSTHGPIHFHWKQGEDCIIVPSVSDEDARTQFPGGWTAELPYLRRVPQPGREPEQESEQAATEQQPA